MKTTAMDKINEIECGKNRPFPAYLYGSIRSTDTKVKKLVTGQNNKLVGAVSSRFKGKVYLFTFDLASGGDYRKLAFLDTLMTDLKHDPPIYVSDPNIDVYVHKGEKAFSIFLLAPPAGELMDATDFRKKQILLKVDLRKAGFKGTRIKLVDQFGSEEDQPIRTSVDELKSGITLDIDSPDGRLFLVSK
jgi:hypothetical protein